LPRGYLSPACVWRSCSYCCPVHTWYPTGILTSFQIHALLESTSLLASFPRARRVASLACYISNTHASRLTGAVDVTCCIWDVVQV
jgi:hypothetical protein